MTTGSYHYPRNPVSMHAVERLALKSKPFLAIFLVGLLFAFPWISGGNTDHSIECASIYIEATHEIAALRAEIAMLRSILDGYRDRNEKTRFREDAMVHERKVSLN